MTYKSLPMVNNTRGCSRELTLELRSLSPSDRRPVQGIQDNRRKSSQLISPCAKLVCAVGLLIIMACGIILIVTHVGQSVETDPEQYSILVLGGITASGETSSVEEISLGLCPKRVSQSIPDLPTALGNPIGGYLASGAVFTCGLSDHGGQSPACFIFRSGASQWDTFSPIMEQRHFSAMGVVENQAYIIGGSSPSSVDGSPKSEVYSDVNKTWSLGPALPAPVHHHCVASYDGLLYTTGGYQHGRAIYSTETNIENLGWKNHSLALHPRYYHGCAVVPLLSGPHLLMSGGLDPDTGDCAHTELLSLNQGSHTAVPGHSECRTGATLVELGGRVLMVGGKSPDGDLPEDLLELDADMLSWQPASSENMSLGRYGHVALKIPCDFHAKSKPTFHKLLEMP